MVIKENSKGINHNLLYRILFEIVSFLSCFYTFSFIPTTKKFLGISLIIFRAAIFTILATNDLSFAIYFYKVTIIVQMARSLKKKHVSSRPIPTEPRNASVRLSSSFSRMFRSPISPRVHSLFLVLSRVPSSY